MGKFNQCKRCHNMEPGAVLYKCRECGERFCDDTDCSNYENSLFSSRKQICPRCDSTETSSYYQLNDDDDDEFDDSDAYDSFYEVPQQPLTEWQKKENEINFIKGQIKDSRESLLMNIGFFGPGHAMTIVFVIGSIYSIFKDGLTLSTIGNIFGLILITAILYIPVINWILFLGLLFVPLDSFPVGMRLILAVCLVVALALNWAYQASEMNRLSMQLASLEKRTP